MINVIFERNRWYFKRLALVKLLPTGKGILPFKTVEELIAAIDQVLANYEEQARAARDIAEQYFDSDKVLTKLIQQSFESMEIST